MRYSSPHNHIIHSTNRSILLTFTLQDRAASNGLCDGVAALLDVKMDRLEVRSRKYVGGLGIHPFPLHFSWSHASQAARGLHVEPFQGFVGRGGQHPGLTSKK